MNQLKIIPNVKQQDSHHINNYFILSMIVKIRFGKEIIIHCSFIYIFLSKTRFVHVLPNDEYRQSLIHLPSNKWQFIERHLSIFNIQTGILNCSNNEYSNLCRTL